MASLPSVALSGTLKVEPELKKRSSASLPTEKSASISYQRSSVNTQLAGSSESIRPLEIREALSLIKDGTKIESSCYIPLLQHCLDKNSVSETQVIHAHVIKTGIHEEVFTMAFLLNVYAKCGDMTGARKVFDNLPRKNVVTWTTLITGYVQNSQPELAIEGFKEMLESGSFPSNITVGIALNACFSLNSIKLGKQLHAFVIKYQIDHDTSIGNALCSLYSRFGCLESAVRVSRTVVDKNVISWTAIISACGQNGEAARGLRFFLAMLLDGIEPNEHTLTTVLSLCCVMLYLGLGAQIHSLSIKLGHVSCLRVANSILYLYLKCGCIEEARNLFNRMEAVSLVTWNGIISGHAQAMDLAWDDLSALQSGIEALNIYLKLNRSGMKPDHFTLSSILTICSRLVALEQGKQIHAQTIKSGVLSDLVVATALVDMYSRCGSIERASKAFVEMSSRTLISWTAMISNFAKHGYSQQALQLFEDMRLAGFRPNQITFVGVLAACGHTGMVEEAHKYFEMMQKRYKIKPVMGHYECLVDMYVRLGRLDEAFDLIQKMDYEANEFIWSLLIAGCRNHGNQELGLYAAERLLQLKPRDIGTYVLLLNLYISADRWEDVAKVRQLMKEEKLGTLMDWSWISIKSKIYSFKTNDPEHPVNGETCKLLQELLDKAKNHGYKPLESMEVIEEAEEEILFSSAVHHNEKLAVAFGLLNTQRAATIRVNKNTGMCRDCHNFIKIVSSLSNRKIFVRDSKKIHKFVNGQCSCADFDGLI